MILRTFNFLFLVKPQIFLLFLFVAPSILGYFFIKGLNPGSITIMLQAMNFLIIMLSFESLRIIFDYSMHIMSINFSIDFHKTYKHNCYVKRALL